MSDRQMARKEKTRTAEPVERGEVESSAAPSRVTIKLDSKGAPDWDQVSQAQKDALIEAFQKDPDAAKMLGLTAGGPDAITPEQIKPALDIVSMFTVVGCQVMAVKKFHHPIEPDLAAKIPLTELQKNTIASPAARAANQYVPDAAKKHVDLGLAISALVGAFTANITAVMTMQAVRDFQRQHGQDKNDAKGNGRFVPDRDATVNEVPAP